MFNKALYLIGVFIFTLNIYAQAPEKMSYQGVVRDSGGTLVTNQTIGMQISILQASPTGSPVYVETHSPTTNSNGLFTVEIGTGTIISGVFSNIDWALGPFFVKNEIDITGGTNYTINGTSELLSVPYALYSRSTASVGPCQLNIGDIYQGGYIFYLDGTGCHGLVANLLDQSQGYPYASSPGYSVNTQAYYSGPHGGKFNDKMILTSYSNSILTAAELCENLVSGGYDDWYLPSKYELRLMYLNIGPGAAMPNTNIANFSSTNYYWSSTEENIDAAWAQHFSGNVPGPLVKPNTAHVRAIRSF